jgi:hypothetical protein
MLRHDIDMIENGKIVCTHFDSTSCLVRFNAVFKEMPRTDSLKFGAVLVPDMLQLVLWPA